MTDRVFEDSNNIEVDGAGSAVEVWVFDDREVTITVEENVSNWDAQRASIKITAAEATAIKEFFIKQGF